MTRSAPNGERAGERDGASGTRPLMIDGLIVGRPSRALFEAMHDGGLAAVNCTCGIWEGLEPSLRALGQWRAWIREHHDLLTLVRGVDDIRRAYAERRVGVILGWQNSTGFGEYLPSVELFAEMGLRVVQLTYHTANMAGSGCLESRDGGLTDFGRDLVAELNRSGILIDLSHVGSRTADETIRESRRPVAYTHCAPRALKDHPRNKTDDEMRFIAENGGIVGVTMFPPFMPRGNRSTIEDYLDAIEHAIGVAGEEAVALGSDFTQGRDGEGMEVFLRDKGYGRRLLEIGDVVMPEGIRRIEEFPNLPIAMERRGWNPDRIERVLAGNWLRLFAEVWPQR